MFGRTDEEVRPTFELIRQGKMPESKTMLGKMLNNMLTTEVERRKRPFAQAARRRQQPAQLRSRAALLRPRPATSSAATRTAGCFHGAVLNKEGASKGTISVCLATLSTRARVSHGTRQLRPERVLPIGPRASVFQQHVQIRRDECGRAADRPAVELHDDAAG